MYNEDIYVFRTPVNCDTCRHVREIDEVHVSEISWETFYSGYIIVITRTSRLNSQYLQVCGYRAATDHKKCQPPLATHVTPEL